MEAMKQQIEELVEIKAIEERRSKKITQTLGNKVKMIEKDVDILSMKVKEKDQEVRLNDLKIKELKRQVPHGHLKPLKNKEGADNEKEGKQRRDSLNGLPPKQSRQAHADIKMRRGNSLSRKSDRS